MKHLVIIACALFFAGISYAQTNSIKSDAAVKTASKDEVKAKADQGAAAVHELPYVKEEVERERPANEQAKTFPSTSKAKDTTTPVKPSSTVKPTDVNSKSNREKK